jgi:hypothetical protein
LIVLARSPSELNASSETLLPVGPPRFRWRSSHHLMHIKE